MSDPAPLVSVVMPVLDSARYLPEALDSILAQTCRDIELIVIDDGSSDGSQAIIAAYATRMPMMRALYLPRDPSLCSGARARNAAIAVARGTYIAAMDSDDIALPDRIALQVDYLRQHGLDACGGQAEAFGAVAHPMWFPVGEVALRHELIFRVGMLHPTVLARADFMRAHPYDPATAHDDYEWQTRVAFQGRLGNSPATVLRHRVHPDQSNYRFRADFDLDLRRGRFPHVYRLFPDTPPRAYHALSLIAEHSALQGDAELALAAEWLCRLAEPDDPALKARMARRWDEICRFADPAPDEALRARVAAAIDPGCG